MKKLLALVLSLLLVASCFAMIINAEETTEEDAAYTNTLLTFNSETMKFKMLSGHTGMSKPICNSGWEGVRLKLTDTGDPYVTILFNEKYIKGAGLESLDSQAYPFVVFKVIIEGYVEDIELFYCTGDSTTPDPAFSSVTDFPCESSGEAEYVIYDLTDDCEGIYNCFRFDPMGADEDTVIYLCEMAFFATEDEALAYAGYGEDGDNGEDGEGEGEETTEESVEETEEQTEATTEKQTEKETTKAQKTEKETEAADDGCGGIVSIGAVVAMISLGIVCIKKKD